MDLVLTLQQDEMMLKFSWKYIYIYIKRYYIKISYTIFEYIYSHRKNMMTSAWYSNIPRSYAI